jgi:ligand-binding SRPBCC domain-containing protein
VAVHVFQSTQTLSTSLGRAWEFLVDPRNLARITPPALGFAVVGDLPERIHRGLILEYRVRFLFALRLRGVAEITEVEEGKSFVDVQRVGPYRSWRHAHLLRDLGRDRVEIRDEITYEPPLGWLGELLHPLLIAPRLRKIFAGRAKTMAEIFP